jgi:hypothetical protein
VPHGVSYNLILLTVHSCFSVLLVSEKFTLLYNMDLILGDVSQSAVLTDSPAAAATSPHEPSPKLMAQVGAAAFSRLTALTASPAAEFTTILVKNDTVQEEASILHIVG